MFQCQGTFTVVGCPAHSSNFTERETEAGSLGRTCPGGGGYPGLSSFVWPGSALFRWMGTIGAQACKRMSVHVCVHWCPGVPLLGPGRVAAQQGPQETGVSTTPASCLLPGRPGCHTQEPRCAPILPGRPFHLSARHHPSPHPCRWAQRQPAPGLRSRPHQALGAHPVGSLTCAAGVLLAATEPHELLHQVLGNLQVLVTVTGLGTKWALSPMLLQLWAWSGCFT